jgi:hypothetical protein
MSDTVTSRDLHNRFIIVPAHKRLLRQRIVTPSGCWEFKGHRNKDGYGQIVAWVDGKKVVVGAHRLAASLWKGFDLTSPLRQLHSCDNPPCFNPDHLFTGTQRDNMQDCAMKGRIGPRKGESNPRAKLTDDSVREIRRLRKTGMMVTEIATAIGISHGVVKKVLSGESWKHVI